MSEDSALAYSADRAIELAKLWRAGKMIGGDEDGVIYALLDEIERLRADVERLKDAVVPEGWKLVPVEPTREMLNTYVNLQGRITSAESDWEAILAAAPQPPKETACDLRPVEGDLLPSIGETVQIHLARIDQWVPVKVVGYYVWPDMGGSDFSHRVFVRVVDADGYENSRLLKDVRRTPAAAPQPPTAVACCDTPKYCSSVRRCTAEDVERAKPTTEPNK